MDRPIHKTGTQVKVTIISDIFSAVITLLVVQFLIPAIFKGLWPFARPSVTITDPAEGSAVPRLPGVQGTASHIPQDKELWLLVKPPDDPGYYPQPGPIVVAGDGKWFATAYIGEEGAVSVGKVYLVYAALADQEGRAAIQEYFNSAPNFKPLKPPLKRIQLITQVRVVRR